MPLRILFSCPITLGKTGPGRPLHAIKDGLDRSGHDVRVVQMDESLGVGPQHDLFYGTVFDLVNSVEFQKDWDPEVYLGIGCASLLQMERYKAFYKTRAVTTWFSTHYGHAYKLLGEEYKRLQVLGPPIHPLLIWRAKKEHEQSDALIVPSEFAKSTYNGIAGCLGKARVCEFGVDCETFYPSESPVEVFKVLFAGGNVARKGLLYLLRAWIRGRASLGQLTVMGARTSIQDPTVKYLDWIPDEQVPGTYREHSVFCLPSLEEGQALAVLEAMASSLPVVITRETGVQITEGQEGFYVPVRDEGAIRKTLEYLKDDPQLREEMGEHAREYALKRPWSWFGDQVVRVLEDSA